MICKRTVIVYVNMLLYKIDIKVWTKSDQNFHVTDKEKESKAMAIC